MARELLSVREERAKSVLSVRVTDESIKLIDEYARYTNCDRATVVEALAASLLEMPSAKQWHRSNGDGK